MASYHSKFKYLDKFSSDEGLIIASFEPDSGFIDAYLGMDQITSDSYDGTKKFFYGNRYNNVATISITVIKADGTSMSVAENRKLLKWLTGNRKATWLDLYEGDNFLYSFFGNITAVQQQKLDARIIGMQIEFTSIHPWAWSESKEFDCYIGEENLEFEHKVVNRVIGGITYRFVDNIIYKGGRNPVIGVITKSSNKEEIGVIFNDSDNSDFTFSITDDGVVYNDIGVNLALDNQSDELYSHVNLDMLYTNDVGDGASVLTINNETSNEKSEITNIATNEVITISSGQFIVSNKPNKIFGDTFNFVWPRLIPGENIIRIDGTGKASVKFSYRYPIKIGDCAIDDFSGSSDLC